MTLFGPDSRPLEPSRPEPRVTERFATLDVGHVRQELKVLALATGVGLTIDEPIEVEGSDPVIECAVYGRQIDVGRFMETVRKWSRAGRGGGS
jgi:hypothetical protein